MSDEKKLSDFGPDKCTSDAYNQICPFQKRVMNYNGVVSNEQPTMYETGYCAAAECMLWVWSEPFKTPPLGRCGLLKL